MHHPFGWLDDEGCRSMLFCCARRSVDVLCGSAQIFFFALEHHRRRPVIQQALAGDDDCQRAWRAELAQQSNDRNRIGRGEDRAENLGKQKDIEEVVTFVVVGVDNAQSESTRVRRTRYYESKKKRVIL